MPRLRLSVPGLALFLALAAPAAAVPRVSGEAPILNVPGRIVAWKDSAYVAVGRDSANSEGLVTVDLKSGITRLYGIGKSGKGTFLSLSPDGRTVLAVERDSTRAFHLQSATLPKMEWTDLFPVSDSDPHVSWFADGSSFLYQDILDDSVGTPSVFKYALRSPLPRLYMFGCQRPLVAPTADAIVCIGADTLNPGSTRDLELQQPVGLEDLMAGEFRWVAPLRTWVPSEGGWSPDGARVALVGYQAEAGSLERRLYIYSRVVNDKAIVPLKEEGRAGKGHDEDVALWSPHSDWIAIGMLPSRGGGVQGKGGVWLVSPGGNESFQLTPTNGTWTGNPIWVGDRSFVIADGSTPPDGFPPLKYWLVEFEEQ